MLSCENWPSVRCCTGSTLKLKLICSPRRVKDTVVGEGFLLENFVHSSILLHSNSNFDSSKGAMETLQGPNNESYADFHTKWKEEQKQLADDLRTALDGGAEENYLRELVRQVQKHYEDYYAAKDRAVRQDVLTMMQPTWKSPLENAFMWIGGWRPTMIFQLAYAQAGQQLEAELAEFLQGLDTPSMASLSSKQLQRISDLQIATHTAEEELGHRQAVLQQGLVDQPLLTLAATEVAGELSDHGDHDTALQEAMDEKVKALEGLLHDADQLRCETLRQMLKILNPTQAAQFLVAAAQLQMAIRKIGQAKQVAGEPKNGEIEHKNGETLGHKNGGTPKNGESEKDDTA